MTLPGGSNILAVGIYIALNMPEKYKHSRAETNALRRDLRWIFERGDERELMKILRKHGIKDEDPRFSEIVTLFRALRSGKT